PMVGLVRGGLLRARACRLCRYPCPLVGPRGDLSGRRAGRPAGGGQPSPEPGPPLRTVPSIRPTAGHLERQRGGGPIRDPYVLGGGLRTENPLRQTGVRGDPAASPWDCC